MIRRTCDRCGKQIERDEDYFTVTKERHNDSNAFAFMFDACNNAATAKPEYCGACVELAFKALEPITILEIEKQIAR